MKEKILFYTIGIAIYPLLTYVIIPCIIGLQDFHGNAADAAGTGLERAYAYLLECAIAFVIALTVSFIVSHKWLHCAWHAVPIFTLGVFLVWFLPEAKSYIERNRISKYKDYYESGQLMEEGTKIGKYDYSKNGIITYYTEDGHLDRTETWKRGQMNGEYCGYYSNGKLAEKGLKVYCSLHGEYNSYRLGRWLFYREDGTLDDERTYDEGVVTGSKNYKFCWLKAKNGKHIVCGIENHQPFTGDLDKEAIVDNDVIPFYYTGKIINGKFDGPWKGYFNASGMQMSAEGRAVMSKREGEYTAYYPNGQIHIIASYKEDKLEGDYCSYNKDAVVTRPHGTCKYSCHYVDGKRHGLARWWYNDGTLQEESEYDMGTIEGSSREYYEGGGLKAEYTYSYSQKEGPYKCYYKSGALQEEGFYKQQTKASYKSYYEGGKLKELLQEDSEPVHYNQTDNVQE